MAAEISQDFHDVYIKAILIMAKSPRLKFALFYITNVSKHHFVPYSLADFFVSLKLVNDVQISLTAKSTLERNCRHNLKRGGAKKAPINDCHPTRPQRHCANPFRFSEPAHAIRLQIRSSITAAPYTTEKRDDRS